MNGSNGVGLIYVMLLLCQRTALYVVTSKKGLGCQGQGVIAPHGYNVMQSNSIGQGINHGMEKKGSVDSICLTVTE